MKFPLGLFTSPSSLLSFRVFGAALGKKGKKKKGTRKGKKKARDCDHLCARKIWRERKDEMTKGVSEKRGEEKKRRACQFSSRSLHLSAGMTRRVRRKKRGKGEGKGKSSTLPSSSSLSSLRRVRERGKGALRGRGKGKKDVGLDRASLLLQSLAAYGGGKRKRYWGGKGENSEKLIMLLPLHPLVRTMGKGEKNSKRGKKGSANGVTSRSSFFNLSHA